MGIINHIFGKSRAKSQQRRVRHQQTKGEKARSRSKFQIEALEPRLLLSGDVLPLVGADVAAAGASSETPALVLVLDNQNLSVDTASATFSGNDSPDFAIEADASDSSNAVVASMEQFVDIAFNPANGEVLVANNRDIKRIDADSGAVVGSFDIPGSEHTGELGLQILPAAIPSLGGTAAAAGNLLVTNGTASTDKIFALDSVTGDQLAVLDIGQDIDPVAGVFHAGRGTLYLLDANRDQILELNPADGAIVNSFAAPFAIGTGGLAINLSTGELWVGSNESNDLAVVTPTGSLVSLIDVAPAGIDFDVSGLAFKNDFDLLVGSTQGDVFQIHDPRVSMPQDLTGVIGATITVPVNIDNATGILAVTVGSGGITYDTNLLDATNASIRLGPVLAPPDRFGAPTLTPNVNDVAGTISLAYTRNESLELAGGPLSGVLFFIDFQIKATAATGATRLDLRSITLEGDDVIAVVPAPKIGDDETDGIINITAAGQTNQAPTDIALSNASVAENQPSGSAVGNLSVTDPDIGDTHTFTLVAGTGDTDNPSFQIVGNQLRTNAGFDFETKNSYSVRVRATDSGSLFVEKSFSIDVTNVNEAPVITSNGGGDNALVSVPENTTPVTTVTAEDPDAGQTATLTFSIAGGADAAKFTIDGTTGVLSFVTAPDFERPTDVGGNNVYDAIVRVSDAGNLLDEQAIAVTVQPVNDNSPLFTSTATPSVAENTLVVVSLAATDADLPAQTVSFAIRGGADENKFQIIGGNQLRFIAAPDFENPTDVGANNVYNVDVTASDGLGGSTVQNLVVTVTNVNEAPVANNDAAATDEDTSVAISVLTNDSDPENLTLGLSSVTQGAHGGVAINPNGSVTYTPNANYNGLDSFTYTASDGLADGNIATVSITINAVNDAPSFIRGADQVVTEDAGLQTVLNWATTISAGPGDEAGQALTFLVTNDNPSLFAVQPAIAPDGTLTYTSALDAFGSATVTARLQDNGGTASGGADTSAPQSFTITVTPVNDAPVARNDAYAVNEDGVLKIARSQGTLANDSDVEGSVLTSILVTRPTHGVAALRADGSFLYVPAGNFTGSDSFTYKARDGQLDSTVATVTITVNAVNDVPVARKDAYVTNEDTVLSVPVQGVLANDSDVDLDTLSAVLVTEPTHGTLNLNANGSFTYTPNGDFNGSDSFSYKTNDGLADSNITTVSITVNSVNDAPLAVKDAYVIGDDGLLMIEAGQGVLANDSDVESDPFEARFVSGPSHGLVVLRPEGSFVYVADEGFNGADSFTYRANDGSNDSAVAQVIIDHRPVAVGDAYSTDEDTPLTANVPGVLLNDSDSDGDTLNAVLVSNPAHGTLTLNSNGSVSYTPNADYNGSDSFSYKANDGQADSNIATVSIAVNAVNDAPVANSDVYSVDEDRVLGVAAGQGVLVNDGDVENNTLTVALLEGPAHGTLSYNRFTGAFTYSPNANFYGSDSFSYKTNDGLADSNIAAVTITVNPVNDAAIFRPSTTPLTYTENDLPTAIDNGLTITDVDSINLVGATVAITINYVPGEDVLSFTDQLGITGSFSPSTGVLSLSGSATVANYETALRTVRYSNTSDRPNTGLRRVDFQVNDGSLVNNLSNVQSRTISVIPVNDAPVAANDSYSTNEDTQLVVALANGVLSNDSDVDSIPPAVALVNGPQHGTLTLNFIGSFTYTPALNFNGSDSFTYKDNDGQADSNIATVTITVNPLNDIPVAVNESFSVNEDTSLAIPAPGVLANDMDVEHDALSASVVTNAVSGTVTVNADGSFSFTPNANFNGSDSFVYAVSDGSVFPTVYIDQFSVGRDGATIFNDSFTDGNPPPSAPNFLNGNAASYALIGVPGPETGGKLALAPAQGIFNPTGSGFNRYVRARLTQNVLSNTNTFTVTGVFDLMLPTVTGQQYGIRLTDVSTTTPSGNDVINLEVRRRSDGVIAVRFQKQDDVLGTASTIGEIALDGLPHEQIALSLAKSIASSNAITASFFYMDGGLPIGAVETFAGSVDIFHGETTTRPEFRYLTPVATATANITVSPVNDAPSFAKGADQTVAGFAGAQTVLNWATGIVAGPADEAGQTLSFVVSNDNPSLFVVQPTIAPNGTLTYTPAANALGSATVSVALRDSGGTNNGGIDTSAIQTFNINVTPVNNAPVAANDSYSTNEDNVLTVAAPGVRANDSDVENNPLTAAQVSGPSNGTISFNSNGSFSYTPNVNYNGSDSFTYKVNDGLADSNIATVSITVNPVNDTPVAVNDSYSVNEDTPLTINALGVLANDTDIDGDALTASLAIAPLHGTVAVNPNGSFNYTPAANFSGADSFVYRVSDGSVLPAVLIDQFTVSRTNTNTIRNDTFDDGAPPPSAPFTSTYTVSGTLGPETGGKLTLDPSQGALAATFSETGFNSVLRGRVNFNLLSTDSFTVTGIFDLLVPSISGQQYGIRLNDASTSPTIEGNDIVTLDVRRSNGIPVIRLSKTDDPANLTTTIAEIPLDPSHAQIALQLAKLSQTSNILTASFRYVDPGVPPPNFANVGTIEIFHAETDPNAPPQTVNPARAEFRYTTPAPTATANITVNPVNDAPSFTKGGDQTVTEDAGAQTVSNWATVINPGPADEAAQTLSFLVTTDNAALFAVQPSIAPNGTLTYTPAANVFGSATISVALHDNGGTANGGVDTSAPQTFTITVNPVNDAPVAVNDNYISNEDTALTINAPGVIANDTDIDANALSASLVNGPANGTVTVSDDGSFTYTPNANFNGSDSFTYKVNDGQADSNTATVAITINPVDDAPVASNDTATTNANQAVAIAVLANDNDIDGALNATTVTIVSGPSNGTVSIDPITGQVTYSPGVGFIGEDNFTYTVKDDLGAVSNFGTVTVSVMAA